MKLCKISVCMENWGRFWYGSCKSYFWASSTQTPFLPKESIQVVYLLGKKSQSLFYSLCLKQSQNCFKLFDFTMRWQRVCVHNLSFHKTPAFRKDDHPSPVIKWLKMVLRFFFLSLTKLQSPVLRYFIRFEHHYCRRQRTESKETGEKSRKEGQGNRQRLVVHLPPVSLWAHITAWWSQVPRCKEKNQTQIRRGGGLCFYANQFRLWRKKPNKTPLSDGSRVSCQNPSGSRGQGWQPSAPGGPPPRLRLRFPLGCRVARTSAEGQSLAAPPRDVRCKGRAWPPRVSSSSCWRELPVCWCRCLPVTQNLPAQVFGLFFVSLKFCFNSSFIYLNLKLLGIIFGG